MANALGGLLERFQKQEEAAKAANLQRYQQAMEIYDEIISRYRPGGEFGRAALGQLEQRKIRDVGKETQQLISSGLYGTTTMAATGRRWEEAVGGPERLKLEDIQMQRLSQAQIGKAGFIERREDVGPDYGMIAQLASQAGQAYALPRGGAAVPSAYGQYKPLSQFMREFSPAAGGQRVFGRVRTTPAVGGPAGGREPGAGYRTISYGAADRGAVAPTAPTPTTVPQISERQRQIQAWQRLEKERGRKLTPSERLGILRKGGV